MRDVGDRIFKYGCFVAVPLLVCACAGDGKPLIGMWQLAQGGTALLSNPTLSSEPEYKFAVATGFIIGAVGIRMYDYIIHKVDTATAKYNTIGWHK